MKPKSKLGSLSWRDVGQGALMFGLSTALATALAAVTGGASIGVAILLPALKLGGIAAAGYIVKQLSQNSKGELLTKEPETTLK